MNFYSNVAHISVFFLFVLVSLRKPATDVYVGLELWVQEVARETGAP